MTEADLRNSLRDCYDPLLRRNIVELGLVRLATLTQDTEAPGPLLRYIANITLAAPSTDEAANAQLTAQITNRLLGLEAISHAHVHLLPPAFPILR